jgi:hypothetical protein
VRDPATKIARALRAKGYEATEIRWERLRHIGNVHEDFSWMEGGWFVLITPACPMIGFGPITGLSAQEVLEFIELLPDAEPDDEPE